MGEKVFPICGNSSQSKEGPFGLDETDVEMGINREVNEVLPSSTQFPNLEPTLFVDMSPSVVESAQECEPESGGTEDAIPQNDDISLTPELLSYLDKIIPDASYDSGHTSEMFDLSLIEGFPEAAEVDNNYMESVCTPIINDPMMSPTPLGILQEEPPAAAASTPHLDPPTLSIPEEERNIVPTEIQEMCNGFLENEALTVPLEDVEMTENSHVDQNIISNSIDDTEFPINAGHEDLLQVVLEQCLGPQNQVCHFDLACTLFTDIR